MLFFRCAQMCSETVLIADTLQIGCISDGQDMGIYSTHLAKSLSKITQLLGVVSCAVGTTGCTADAAHLTNCNCYPQKKRQ